ncbi:MAG TPA: L,D-transpeptidase/peptidoglycan binding protein [Actinomycetota bacterium]|nr:L,D-transpeptidase/peptidoglycan binding protein [Actinomycetota bacterium]
MSMEQLPFDLPDEFLNPEADLLALGVPEPEVVQVVEVVEVAAVASVAGEGVDAEVAPGDAAPTIVVKDAPPPPLPALSLVPTVSSQLVLPPELAYMLGPDDEVALAPPPPPPNVVTIDSSTVTAPNIVSPPGRWYRRLRLGGRAALVAAILGGLFALSGAGISYAAYDYGREYDGKILPGVEIAGVDVGGMERDEAIEAVSEAIKPELTRIITLQWGEKTWKVTPARLGAHSDAEQAVDAALSASADTSFLKKARMSLFGDSLGFDRDLAIAYPRKGVHGFVEGLASSLHRPARDASIDYSTGWVKVKGERFGREVKVKKTQRALMRGLEGGASNVPLALKIQKPEVLGEQFEKVLLLRNGENKLYLYENGKIIRSWTVAPGTASYPTPSGVFEITEKRYMPTWVNPAPTGWGASMPASIPPGIGNPLGLRALNWSADAIRFHGTSAIYSLGYNASHGCVRMSNEDVIELYDLVEVGTPIISTVVAPLRPL